MAVPKTNLQTDGLRNFQFRAMTPRSLVTHNQRAAILLASSWAFWGSIIKPVDWLNRVVAGSPSLPGESCQDSPGRLVCLFCGEREGKGAAFTQLAVDPDFAPWASTIILTTPES
jgi:hypothetical protein